MADNSERTREYKNLEAAVRRLEAQFTSETAKLNSTIKRIDVVSERLEVVRGVQSASPAAPVANLVWNGELGHSVNTWHDTSLVTTDKSKECAWFHSHGAPFKPKTFTTITTNNEIPLTAHNIEDGTYVGLLTTGTLPSGGAAPPTTFTFYYTYAPSPNVIKLCSTRALALSGAADITFNAGTGSGTHTLYQKMDVLDARNTSTNHTIKKSNHSLYSIRFGDWDSVNGQARLTERKSLDTPLPSNFIDATIGKLFVSFVAARRNQYIEIPDAARIGVGVWDSSFQQYTWLKGDVGFTAAVVGTPGATTERRYRIFVQTDQGYSILSPEVALTGAPTDASFSSSVYVQLNWRQLPGVLQVQIWRYNVVAGTYEVLEETSSGVTSYIDNNTTLRTGGGYPTASETEREALFYTATAEASILAVDGEPWDTLFCPIPIPDNYNKANTTDRQWLRIFQTVACNLYVTGCSTDGSTTITAPASVFEAAYDTRFDAGNLVAEVYDSTGALITTTTVASRTDDTHVVLGTAVAAGSGRILRIVGGGFHGLLIDKVHACFQRNVSFAPNALDARVLQPVAAPSSSTQGGPGQGSGGTVGGGVLCVIRGTPIELGTPDGRYETVEAGPGMCGTYLEGENIHPNYVERVQSGIAAVRKVRLKNGLEKRCTNSHRFRTHKWDRSGTPLSSLRVGDLVYCKIDGQKTLSPIESIGKPEPGFLVHTPILSGGHYYIAGEWVPTRWQRLLILLGLMKPREGGIFGHNRKLPEDP